MALALGVVVLTGCELMDLPATSGDSTLSRDVFEIRRIVEELSDDTKANKRTLDYRLETLEEKVQTKYELLNGTLDGIDKRIRQQNDEIANMRKELQALAFQVDALQRTLDMKPAQPSAQSQALLTPTQTAELTFEEAFKQFNLGRHEDARAGFEQALAQGLAGDQAVQAQFYLAESLKKLGDLNAAHDQYTKLITTTPDHQLSWQSVERLAEINESWGRLNQALTLYEEIIKVHPAYPDIERVREKVQMLRGRQGGDAQPPAAAPPPAR